MILVVAEHMVVPEGKSRGVDTRGDAMSLFCWFGRLKSDKMGRDCMNPVLCAWS